MIEGVDMHCINCNSERISQASAKLVNGSIIKISYCLDCGQVQKKIPIEETNRNVEAEAQSRALKDQIRQSWENE
jgi:uncharacterized Zn finger protein